MGTKQDITCKTKLKMLSLEDTQNYEALFEMRVSAAGSASHDFGFGWVDFQYYWRRGARSSPRFSQRAGSSKYSVYPWSFPMTQAGIKHSTLATPTASLVDLRTVYFSYN